MGRQAAVPVQEKNVAAAAEGRLEGGRKIE
jgi:hypothetical protein